MPIRHWDLTFADGDEPRDSSAAAIAACGMLAMAPYLKKADDPSPFPALTQVEIWGTNL